MKNKLFCIGVLLLIGLFITIIKFNRFDLNLGLFNLKTDDCAEFGECKEGTKYIMDGSTFIINKDTCINHKKEWQEDTKTCYMY